MSTYNKRPLLGAVDNNLVLLVALNAFLFIIINFLRLVYAISYDTQVLAESFFNKQVLNWFVLHATFDKLFTKPWTLIIYMFANYSVWMLISNMLWLWAFGYILQDLAGNKKMFPLYLYGGLIGAITLLAVANLLPGVQKSISENYYIMGGGASIVAIAIATTTLAPDYRIFPLINGGIPLWVLTLIFIAIDFGTLAYGGAPLIMAHLAAAATGYFFIKQLQKGNDLGEWMYKFTAWLNDLFNPEKNANKKMFYAATQKPYEKKANITQQKLDAILDKINIEGYDKLTEDEKAFLKRASKEDLI
jgi:membrane associated rhomboid family serine protease